MSALPLAFSLAILVGAPDMGSGSPLAPAELVKKLGDKSYRVRHSAAFELVRAGSAAVPALTDGIKNPDLEISERCRQLLPQATARERDEKLALLLKDPKSPLPKGLAGLEAFIKITGDDKFARETFAEMINIHHVGLEVAETSPAKSAEYYQSFCEEAYGRYMVSARSGRYNPDAAYGSRADMLFFLVASADVRFNKGNQNFGRSYVLLNGTKFTSDLTTGDRAPVMKKLFLNWLENEPQSYLQQRGFAIAAQIKMAEVLPLIVRALEKKDGPQQQYNKAQIMVTLVQFGKKEHAKVLEPYLNDASVVTTVNFGNGPQTTVQFRDVALGVYMQLLGQKPQDFGYGIPNLNGGNGNNFYAQSYIYYGFPEEKERNEVRKKWKEWVDKNPTAGAIVPKEIEAPKAEAKKPAVKEDKAPLKK